MPIDTMRKRRGLICLTLGNSGSNQVNKIPARLFRSLNRLLKHIRS